MKKSIPHAIIASATLGVIACSALISTSEEDLKPHCLLDSDCPSDNDRCTRDECRNGTCSYTKVDDMDGDSFPCPQDCDDSNSAVNPEAREVCNNIDDNCDGETDAVDGISVCSGCLPDRPVDCGIYCCLAGEKCSDPCRCIPQNSTCCSDGSTCGEGETCWNDGVGGCMPDDAILCQDGRYFCQSDERCASSLLFFCSNIPGSTHGCIPDSNPIECGTDCCPATDQCCGDKCCPPPNECCGGSTCCAPDLCCGSSCCPSGSTCCGGTCCSSGQTCCNGVCCSNCCRYDDAFRDVHIAGCIPEGTSCCSSGVSGEWSVCYCDEGWECSSPSLGYCIPRDAEGCSMTDLDPGGAHYCYPTPCHCVINIITFYGSCCLDVNCNDPGDCSMFSARRATCY
jgi:hypothetical protein